MERKTSNKACDVDKDERPILVGAAAIADYIFGDAKERRKVYHAVAKSRLPVFRIGSVICARPARLDTFIVDQENRNLDTENSH